jgi:hypothetical protein
MPFAGRSYLPLIFALGAWIAIVFVVVAQLTNTSRRGLVAALVGGLVAGGVNVATDAAAHSAGYWRYPEATTPFGPLLYYFEAGIGCAALALVARWLHRRSGLAEAAAFVAALGVYGPLRDRAVAEMTGLVDFTYEPLVVVVVADALSGFVVPTLVALAAIVALDRPRRVFS